MMWILIAVAALLLCGLVYVVGVFAMAAALQQIGDEPRVSSTPNLDVQKMPAQTATRLRSHRATPARELALYQ
jgi:hypothetical protein